MKQSKRILSFVFAVCILVASIVTTGISVSAAELASGTCGESATWTLDDSGLLTVSGVKMDLSYRVNVNASGSSLAPWYDYRDSITKVVFEEGIKNISVNAFNGCTNLTEVVLPGTLLLLGVDAFSNCPNLTKVVAPETITYLHNKAFVNSDNVAFYGVLNSYAHTFATENGFPFFEYVEEEEPVVATPEITTNGHKVSITCADKISTIRFAEGVYKKLADIKTAPGNVVIDKKRIDLNTTDSVFNYDIYNNGTYTFWYKMDTGESYMTYVEMKDAVVTFAEAGLKITLGNLDGIKVIRTAAGAYNTANEVKYAAGARSYSAKTVIKDAETYTLQYKSGGVYTIAVIYDNGHEVIYQYNSIPQVDSVVFEQDGNKATLSGLDNVKVVRYAKGEYTTGSAIKNAEGVVAVAKKYIKDNTLSISNLESGVYTVYVQMEDESFAFYNVAVD